MLQVPNLLQAVGIVSMLFGGVFAVSHNDLRKSLAYIAIAEAGMVTCAFGIGTPLALYGGLLLIIAAALAKVLLFLFSGLFETGLASESFGVALFGFLVGGFSIIGVPLTAGFAADFAMVSAAYSAGATLFIVVFAVTTVLLTLTILKIYKQFVVLPKTRVNSRYILISMALLATILVALGIIPFALGWLT